MDSLTRNDDLYVRLLQASTLEEISKAMDVEAEIGEIPSENELKSLLGAASGLAMSSDGGDRRRAFEIASRIVQITHSPAIALACQALLARLGNFPGMELIAKKSKGPRQPAILDWEIKAHRIVNTVTVGRPDSRKWILTDFQKRVYDAFQTTANVSFSGPTSSGKSFILALDMVRRIFEMNAVIVYLVPTRALIREVMVRVRQNLEDHGLDIPVRSIPVPLGEEQAQQGAVFVLTQERLLTLLYSTEGHQPIDVLIVDEAQSLGEDARGVVLHSAIDATLAFNSNVQVCFGCPLASNPDLLISLFRNERPSLSFVEPVSPVTQNILLVERVKGSPNQAKLSLLHDFRRIEIGTSRLPFRSSAKNILKRSGLATLVTGTVDATLVYANGRAEAENIAAEIAANLGPAQEPMRPEIREAVRFLRNHIHPSYPLTGLLPHGVAVHYGSMPGIVRNVVEDLFKQRKVRFVVTTSTLLQGVNLPARNIVIHNPRRGKTRPMTPADFRNLAGRAGRLAKEFHGNVWVLHPHDWASRSYEGPELNPVHSALDQALTDGGTIALRALDETPVKGEEDYGVATLGKLYSEFGPGGKALTESRYKTEQNESQLTETEKHLKDTSVSVVPEVLRRNSTMHPVRLGKLSDWMKSQPIDRLMPLHPKRQGFYDNFKGIARITARMLERDSSETYNYHTSLAARWINSVPLKKILDTQLEFKRKAKFNKGKSDGRLLTEILNDIEIEIRYKMVKNLRAYSDVLRAELSHRGAATLIEKIPPLHLFLECGSSNQAELNLISLGLSRTTAILLAKRSGFREEQTPEQTLQALRNLSIQSLDLPEACLAEIRAFSGRHA